MIDALRTDQCNRTITIDADARVKAVIPDVVGRLKASCGAEGCYDHVSAVPIPSEEAVVEVIHIARRLLFPGFFTRETIDPVNIEYYLGQEITRLYNKLANEIAWAIRHDCFRYEQVECAHCIEQGKTAALAFLDELPALRLRLGSDVQAAYEGDPAARSVDQIIFSYPSLFAVTVQRLAHVLYLMDVPLIPRIMTEYAHHKTGIDIHPGAVIGDHFFIDHGTGVVIGETTKIGDRVRLYQGVTLGALSLPRDAGAKLRGKKRHPTIENDVIVYSGATILGGETVIGARSVIGGNVWLTESVPPDSRVLIKSPELIIQEKKKKD